MIRILGLMAGSSRDGIDMAICYIQSLSKGYNWGMEATRHVPLPNEWQERLSDATSWSASDLLFHHSAFGDWLGLEAKNFIAIHDEKVSLIAAHGQTIYHQPHRRLTFQLGHGANIAAVTSIDTITDFRSSDIAHGGQGAPFAPVVDNMMFPGYEAYLNLGGIANVHISHLPAKAWDAGPCNQVLNYLAMQEGYAYDNKGHLAREGKVDTTLLRELLSFNPPDQGKPRGLANAEISATWEVALDRSHLSVRDTLRTTVEAIALNICSHLNDATSVPLRVLVTGGGAFNSFLIERLEAIGSGMELQFHIPDDQIVQYKECLLMCCLGYMTYKKQNFGLSGLTGAQAESSGGAYYSGKHE